MLAEKLFKDLVAICPVGDVPAKPKCLSTLEVENLAEIPYNIDLNNTNIIYVFIISTFTDGQAPEKAAWFCKSMEEHANDFRVPKTYLRNIKYTVFGLGNSEYKGNYNLVRRCYVIMGKIAYCW